MTLQPLLKSQYRASLSMLLDAIESCPVALWTSHAYLNRSWQVAYHALFYTDFYLQPSEAAFVPWEHHRPGHHRLGTDPGAVISLTPYSQEEVTSYGLRCRDLVDAAVDRLDLASPESGFSWYRMSKLEHQFVNLRHLQHHTGQLADRLRQAADRGLVWVGGTRET